MKKKCIHVRFKSFINKLEKEYNINIYQLKYYDPLCGTFIETKKITPKGVGFKKWVKSLSGSNK